MFITFNPSLVIRPLVASDSPAYRALRTKILNTSDARYFSDSYERERQLTESEWLQWCSETPEHCILGTFDECKLIGIVMITRQGDSDSPIVEWEAVWLDPSYRGKGIGKAAYEKAKKWSQSQGYKYIVEFIRADNATSLHICMNIGFKYAYTIRNELWADGSVADTHAYLLDLRSEAYKYSLEPVNYRFKEVFPYLIQGFHAPMTHHESEVA
jgi:RimJ/RimL family protein N-acetyltransferase